MTVISHAQFASMEGGSRRLSDQTEAPKSGYYVSRDPDVPVAQGGSPEAKGGSTEEGVRANYDAARAQGALTALPGRPASEVYQGKWMDMLDVSDRYPASTSGLMHALQHGMANVQLAAWAAHNPVHGEEFGPGDKREVSITGENAAGEKTGHPVGVQRAAHALHTQEMNRRVSRPTEQSRAREQQYAERIRASLQ